MTETVEIVQPSDFSQTVPNAPANKKRVTNSDLVVIENKQIESEEQIYKEHFFEEQITVTQKLMPKTVGSQMIVDALVGQINGKPIFAQDILEPIEDQLQIAGNELNQSSFKEVALGLVSGQLEDVLISELLLSEAKAGMSVEREQGLIATLQQMKEHLASKQGGSQRALAQQIMTEQEKTIEEFLDSEQQQVLIYNYIKDKISSRIQVTWRDVERAWERHGSNFETKGSVTIGRIRIPVEDEELLVSVNEKFDQGISFEVVATDLGLADGGRWDSFELGEDGIGGTDLGDEIASLILTLDIGEVGGPILIGSNQYWFSIIDLQLPAKGSIWDPLTQMQIRGSLVQIEQKLEHDRHLESILADGSFDELEAMVRHVTRVAMSRYMH